MSSFPESSAYDCSRCRTSSMIARLSAGSWSRVAIGGKGNLPPVSDGAATPAVPASTLLDALGFEPVELGDERAVGRFPVTDRVRQPFGVVHGGAYASMAESLAPAATYQGVAG